MVLVGSDNSFRWAGKICSSMSASGPLQQIFNIGIKVSRYSQGGVIPVGCQKAGHPVIRNMNSITSLVNKHGNRSARAISP
jgi:hypothetical protein